MLTVNFCAYSVPTIPVPTPLPSPTYLLSTAKRLCHDYWLLGVRQSGIQPVGYEMGAVRANVYCDMASDGGWTVIMRRTNGKESFQRGWMEYASGFGNLTADFWLGNRVLVGLTNKLGQRLTLMVEVTLCGSGQRITRSYREFWVGDEIDRFRLTVVQAGNESDYFGLINGKQFYAANLHNSLPNCGNTHGGGGWWWSGSNCTLANFSGKFGCNQPYPMNMYWVSGRSGKHLGTINSVVMKVKPTE